MAGSKINDYNIGDANIQSVMLTLDKAYKGLHQVSLTNYDTTAESQIAAGSVVENNGALYQFTSNESITGSPSDGTVYIRLVPAGDTITAEYTNTAPTWSDSKQGWYGTGGDANNRYIGGVTLSGSSWTYKFVLIDKNGLGLQYFKNTFSLGAIEELILKKISIEDLQMYAIGSLLLDDTWRLTVNVESSKDFIIKKPLRMTIVEDAISLVRGTIRLDPGTYRLHRTSGGTLSMQILTFIGGSYRACTCNSGFGNIAGTLTASLYCVYAEGVTELDDVTKLYEPL